MSKQDTRANVPPRPNRSFLPEPAHQPAPVNNMRGESLAPMTFNMPRDWHMRFKMTATSRGMNMKELLIASFEAWEREEAQKAK